MERLYESFERLDVDKNRSIEGTGLGLAITKQLVSMMNGKMHVESKYGKGTTFTVEIPQRFSNLEPIKNFDETLSETYKQKKLEDEHFVAPDAKIMIVDDNRVNLVVAEALLKDTKAQITLCTSGMECIDKIQKEKYDIIFLDHMMPDMDGIEKAKRIRAFQDEYYKKIPIIAFTANAIKGVNTIFTDAGMNDYLFKPVRGVDMKRMVKKWLPQDRIICVENLDASVVFSNAQVEIQELLDLILNKEQEDKNGSLSSVLDEEEALKLVGGNYNSYQEALRIFAEMIGEKASIIERYEKNEEINKYTIEIHALKNSARMIGASNLSEMAASLEKFGEEGNMEEIHTRTPQLLSLYRSYTDILEPYSEKKDDSVRKEVNKEQIITALNKLISGIDDFDIEVIDETVSELESYSLEGKYRYFMNEIVKASLNVNYDICAEWAKQLLEQISKSE